jgi:hypothetical protein
MRKKFGNEHWKDEKNIWSTEKNILKERNTMANKNQHGTIDMKTGNMKSSGHMMTQSKSSSHKSSKKGC